MTGPKRHPLTRRTFVAAATAALSLLAVGSAQDSATSTTKTQLGPADSYFVTQTSLGTPFQVDSGRLAQEKSGTEAIRSYAELMVGSHIAVNDALETIVKRKAQVPPPTLLKAAYEILISTLEDEAGQRFDANYVRGQVSYQKANAALYRYEIDNGADPDLKAFAQHTLPKIQDHLERALKLERELRQSSAVRAPEGSAGGGQAKPTVSYWHVETDEHGVSHQRRCDLSAFKEQSISPGAAPEWLDKLGTPGATVLVAVQPVGWVGEWHENPKPQWIVPLSGRWFVETMDGMRVEMGPGEASFGNDQNCKSDAQGHKGHRSGTVGNQPSVLLIVQLERDPGTGQSCHFK